MTTIIKLISCNYKEYQLFWNVNGPEMGLCTAVNVWQELEISEVRVNIFGQRRFPIPAELIQIMLVRYYES